MRPSHEAHPSPRLPGETVARPDHLRYCGTVFTLKT
jgi:hypothetical protein